MSSLFLKTHFTNIINLDVSRETGFPEFPNTSPSGKWVDSDDPIPQKSQNFSKKRHPQNVGGDTRPPEISQWSNRGVFVELPLLAPINRGMSLLKKFHRSHAFFRTLAFTFRGKAPRDQVFAASRLPRTFLRYCFLCYLVLVSTFHHTRIICFANFIHECRLAISYECHLYYFLLVSLSNRWLELKVPRDPQRPKNWLQLAFRPN
jgi:hypothetical protein